MALEHIQRYEVKAELGRGGMAAVYRAYDPRFKREVAIKVLPPQFLHDPSFRARFEREAQAIAAIEHPAIVPVYDFGEENGQPFLVMRYMAGGSLSSKLEKGPISLTESAKIISRLAPALDEMHRRGIIHRDLKPANILFDQYNNAYLADFGIARITEATTALTGDVIIGTPSYMSPEQARGDPDIDGRSDIYALGAILFEMLTGQQPYQGTTPMGIAMKHLVEPVPRILTVRADLPQECQHLIDRAMAKDRTQRFQTATALALKQEEMIQGRKLTAGATSLQETTQAAADWPPPQTPSPVPPRSRTPPPIPAVSHQKNATPAPQPTPAQRTPSGAFARPAQAARKRPVWFWALPVALVVFLAGICGLGGLSKVALDYLNPPTLSASILTEDEEPPQIPAADEDTDKRPARRELLNFKDDFSDPKSGWTRGEESGSVMDYARGSFRIYVDKPNMIYWSTPNLFFKDVSIEVETTKVGGPDSNYIGVICRYIDGANFYIFSISSNGVYGIGKYKEGTFSLIGMEEFKYSSYIHQGRTSNIVRAECIRNTLILFVNNTRLAYRGRQRFHRW
jgi:serine/threonine protein kinase